MIGHFLTRGLVMLFGYAYPAYECFKTVEKNKPDIEQLRFWCQYWILIAMLTIFERVGDNFVSWVPMYSEAKLAFVIFLWYPKTKGTTYVYDSFFRPYMAKHETEIDRNLMELKTRAGEMAFVYCQRAASYGQTRIFEVLQYVAAQSTPTPRPPPAQAQPRVRQPPPTRAQTTQPQKERPSIPSSSSTSSSQQVEEVGPELSSTTSPSSSDPSASMPEPIKKSVSMPVATERSSQSASNHVEEAIEKAAADNANANPPAPPQDTVMEEGVRVTRARLRKAHSASTK